MIRRGLYLTPQRRIPVALRAHPVGARVIAYDLKFLTSVLNWATVAGDGLGGVLIVRNPLKGFAYPREESPRRPMLTGEEFAGLLAAAANVDPLFELFLVVMYETGHRANSVRQLRWTDIDLERRLLTWRKEGDKLGHEHTTALSATAADRLTAAQRSRAAIGAVSVFPSPRRRGEPLSRHTLAKWSRMAETASKIGRVPGRGPHALRRMFANELRHVPLRDLADLGGWKSSQTIVQVYQQPDVDAQRVALDERRPRRSAKAG